MFDILIEDGILVDGTGTPGIRGSIALQDGKIAALGRVDGPAKRVLNVQGRCVTPGFLDIHRHADAAVFRPGFGQLELCQGLTTIVNGNCGLSIAPIGPAHRAEIMHYLEPITGQVPETVQTGSMAEYLRQLESQPLPIHVGMLVGGGVLRADAAGYTVETLEPEHYAAIAEHLNQALADGALGVSLGLGYAPECFYSTKELVTALLPLRGTNIPITVHMREEGDAVTDALGEMLTVGRALGTPVHISHLKAMGRRNWGSKIPAALRTMALARREGVQVSCDVYPYTAGSTQLMHILPPDFLTGGVPAIVQRLRDPECRARLTRRIREDHDFDNIAQLVGWENIVLSTLNLPEHKCYEGMSIQAIAEQRGQDPFDCCYDLLAEEECNITMVDFITCEEDITAILQDPYSNVISDSTYPTSGQLHPRVYGTFARILQHFVREKKALSLEEAVRKMTKVPADVLNLRAKGRLQVGADADLNIFAPGKITERATYQAPEQLSEGMEYVFVGGVMAIENGSLTGRCGGRVLRRQQDCQMADR